MNIKKIVAGALAGAMVIGCMILPAGASYEFGDTTGTGEWTQESFLSSSDAETDLSTADTVIVHANCADLGYGWNNGSFYADTESDWIQVSYGGYECDGQSWFATDGTILNSEGTFDMTISLAGSVGEDFDIGYGTSATYGAFAVESVEVYAGSTLLATWVDGVWEVVTYDTTLTCEITETVKDTASSYTVTIKNADGDTAEVSGNTYFVDGGKYYIGVDVSDIPIAQTVSIESVSFDYE